MKKSRSAKPTPNKKRKSKKLPHTPNGQIIHALRKMWLRSRERAATLKRDGYTCQSCGRKQSRRKGAEFDVTVHHLHGIDWTGIAQLIRERILQTPGDLQTLCRECHDLEHGIEHDIDTEWMK